jgi:3-oxoacyl-[acyl-carrier protein] reductase
VDQLLKNKTALVTGGTAGIGKEISLTFAKEGADVAIVGTHLERAQDVVREMHEVKSSATQRFSFYILDVANKAEVDRAVQHLLQEWGRVDVLVNNAGITRDGLLMRMSEEDWDIVLAVNLKSVYNVSQALVRPMLKAKSGNIINISSVVGLTGNAGQVNYAASKSGMIGFTKSLAKEVASRGVRVNCIAPGFILTGMTDVLTEPQREAILAKIPMNCFGVPRDVACAALFFASYLSNYVTGQVLTVDGGMT